MIENKILKWALILGIIIVLNLFFAYALKVIYNAPEWDEYCQKEQVEKRIDTEESCLEVGGAWKENDKTYEAMRYDPVAEQAILEKTNGWCDRHYECRLNYEEDRESYEKNVFMTLVALGVISIIVGFFMASIELVSMALSLGGVLTFIVASIRYWEFAGEYLQVGILALALAVLIYLGVKKFK